MKYIYGYYVTTPVNSVTVTYVCKYAIPPSELSNFRCKHIGITIYVIPTDNSYFIHRIELYIDKHGINTVDDALNYIDILYTTKGIMYH